MYTPPVTPREFVTPEDGGLTFKEGAGHGGTDDWGEGVTREPYRKVRLDHLLSKDKEYVGNSFSFECSKHSKKRIKFNRGL